MESATTSPPCFFLQPQGFFEGVTVRLVHFEANVRFLDPISGDGQRRVFRRNLLDAHDDVHGVLPSLSLTLL